jgi:hypothetical protein
MLATLNNRIIIVLLLLLYSRNFQPLETLRLTFTTNRKRQLELQIII